MLAQWPLKSIRCYESSGGGQLSIEAGRVAPMGDGLYIFQTRPGDANGIYDLLDQYVMDTVGRAQVQFNFVTFGKFCNYTDICSSKI